MNNHYMISYRIPFALTVMVWLGLTTAGWSAASMGMPTSDRDGGKDSFETPQKTKHELHWWESASVDRNTPALQMKYADDLKKAGKLDAASKAYRALTYRWPESTEAPVAQLNYASRLDQKHKYQKAFDEYQYLIDTYAGFFPFEDVLERQYIIADTLATRTRYFLFIPYHSPEEAIPLFEKLIQNGPQWKRASELQFRIARIYEKNEEYDMAIESYAIFLQRYPLSPQAEYACFGQAKSAYLYAKENPVAVDLRENAIASLRLFIDSYPGSGMAPLSQTYLQELQMDLAKSLYEQAMDYDNFSKHASDAKESKIMLTGARVCYQRLIEEFPNSRWSETARSRLNQIYGRLEKLP